MLGSVTVKAPTTVPLALFSLMEATESPIDCGLAFNTPRVKTEPGADNAREGSLVPTVNPCHVSETALVQDSEDRGPVNRRRPWGSPPWATS